MQLHFSVGNLHLRLRGEAFRLEQAPLPAEVEVPEVLHRTALEDVDEGDRGRQDEEEVSEQGQNDNLEK